MVWRKVKTLFLFVIAVVAPAKPAKLPIKIFFVPFGVRTYVPITEQNIERQAFICVFLKHDWIVGNIKECIHDEAAARVNDRQIRLKIVMEGDTYFFDSMGNGTKNKSGGLKLDIVKIREILGDDKVFIPVGPQAVD